MENKKTEERKREGVDNLEARLNTEDKMENKKTEERRKESRKKRKEKDNNVDNIRNIEYHDETEIDENIEEDGREKEERLKKEEDLVWRKSFNIFQTDPISSIWVFK